MLNRLFRQLLLCSGLAILCSPAFSHEFWIAPERYQVASGESVVARLRNGQRFRGAEQPYLDHRINRFEVIQSDGAVPYSGRMGDMPAFATATLQEGLAVLVHQTRPHRLVYDSWETFEAFIDHKRLGAIRQAHRARGLPDSGFAEHYTRYAKALVAVGAGVGKDRPTGMETEFVALANPYTDQLAQGFPVQLHYRGALRPHAQVEIFAKAPDGSVTVTTRQTDAQGTVTLPVLPGHQYLLDAVVLRPAPQDADFAWESHWASLTFAVPPR
jgi:uncharacterized GH25 family protein